MMDYTARLVADGLDQAMLLFRLRQAGASAEFHPPPKGGDDVQLTGEVPDDRVDDLVKALSDHRGALHVAGKNWRIGGGEAEICASIEEAEAALGAPYTVLGTRRTLWSFGGSEDDALVQWLYFRDAEATVPDVVAGTDLGVEAAMKAMQRLSTAGVTRKFRREEGGRITESYGLARAIRAQIDAGMPQD